MTIRQMLRARQRRQHMAIWLFSAAYVSGALLGLIGLKPALVAVGIALLAHCLMAGCCDSRVRCPECGHILDRVISYWSWSGTSRYWPTPQYCPYCRVDFDQEPGHGVERPGRLKAGPDTPTARDIIDQQKRRCWVRFWASLVALVCGVCLAIVMAFIPPLAVVSLTVAGVGLLGTWVTLLPLHEIRCPNCEDSMRAVVWLRSDRPFAIPSAIRFCPFCGIDLDSPR